MKVSILVLTLVVIYGTYRTYAESLIKESTYNGNQLLDFPYPLEKSLSRNKRTILLSPIKRVALGLTTLGRNAVVKTVLDFAGFIHGTLNGQDVCPKIEGLSIKKIIKEIVLHPIQTIETAICYFLQFIGRETRALIATSLNLFSKFLRKVFLPKLHKMLNLGLKIPPFALSPNYIAFVHTFNVFYKILKFLGYVE